MKHITHPNIWLFYSLLGYPRTGGGVDRASFISDLGSEFEPHSVYDSASLPQQSKDTLVFFKGYIEGNMEDTIWRSIETLADKQFQIVAFCFTCYSA